MTTLTVACWHNVEGTWNSPSEPGLGPEGLWKQLRAISRWGTPVSLGWGLDRLARRLPLPARAVALSFDDGYADNASIAVPLLERLCLPATFFLTPALLSREMDPWWETLSWAVREARAAHVNIGGSLAPLGTDAERAQALRRLLLSMKGIPAAERETAIASLVEALEPTGSARTDEMFMDWDDARAAVARGIEVGSHTERHPILSEEDPAEQLRDLETARRRLQSELGVDAALLAYPNGGPEDVNGSAVDAAVRVGHTHGLTTTGGINTPGTDPFSIRRILITPARGTHVLGPLRRRIVARAVRMTKGPRAH